MSLITSSQLLGLVITFKDSTNRDCSTGHEMHRLEEFVDCKKSRFGQEGVRNIFVTIKIRRIRSLLFCLVALFARFRAYFTSLSASSSSASATYIGNHEKHESYHETANIAVTFLGLFWCISIHSFLIHPGSHLWVTQYQNLQTTGM